jgi:hypothetical protein
MHKIAAGCGFNLWQEGLTFAEPELAAVSKTYYVQRQSNMNFRFALLPDSSLIPTSCCIRWTIG